MIRFAPDAWSDYDVIIGDDVELSNIKLIKILKYGKISLIRNPSAIFKKNRNIKFHFDMFHGNGILDKAIDLLPIQDKKDFREYVNTSSSFNRGNMFITKSKSIIEKFYESIFPWLSDCEKIFGFDLKGYNQVRIYAFLAERYLPYWFNKNTNILKWPILFHDLSKENTNEK